ncbi:MAG: glycosyltransferase [Pseudomonadaceae bacterium]
MATRQVEKKVICHLIVGLNVGGAERSLCRLVEAHVGSELYEHHVVCLSAKGPLSSRLESKGVKVYELGLSKPWYLAGVFIKLCKLLRLIQPNVLQCWMYHSDLIGGLAGRLVGVNTILWGIRNSELEAGGTIAKKVLRAICARLSWWLPDEILCVAQSALRVHAEHGYRPDIMKVVPNGFDVENFSFSELLRKKYRSELECDGKIVVGSVGRYCEAKNHSLFVEAAIDAARDNDRLFFLMIGRGVDTSNHTLVEKVRSAGLAERFVFLGEQSDMPGYMSAMDVFCLHSDTEGFPNVLGEAMSVGLPCIATDVGDAAYLLGGAGLILPKSNKALLSSAMKELAEKEYFDLKCLGVKCRERVSQYFTLDQSVKEFEKSYI